jgi:hypothetical protein
MNSVLSIVLGLLIIYLSSFILIAIFTTLYFKLSKRVNIKFTTNLKHIAILALLNLIATLVSIAMFSANRLLFVGMSFIIIAGGYFLLYRFVWKFTKLDSAILALGMAFILNPGWLIFLGII